MSLIGGVGAAAFAAAWVPQCLETWRRGRCDVNAGFLALSGLGSASLALHAFQSGDAVFLAVNALTTGGAALNLIVKLRTPRS